MFYVCCSFFFSQKKKADEDEEDEDEDEPEEKKKKPAKKSAASSTSSAPKIKTQVIKGRAPVDSVCSLPFTVSAIPFSSSFLFVFFSHLPFLIPSSSSPSSGL
jgi:hypothetical protein